MSAPTDGATPPAQPEFQPQRSANPQMDELAAAFYRQAQEKGLRSVEDDPPLHPGGQAPSTPAVAEKPSQAPVEAGADPAEPPTPEPEAPAVEDPSESPAPEAGAASDDQPVVALSDGTQLTAAEIEAGYLRQADYTRKTQEVAEQRRGLESERAAAMGEYEQAVQHLTGLRQQLEGELARYRPSQEQLAQLRHENPAEYAAYMLEEQQRHGMLEAARAEEQRIRGEQMKAQVPLERQRLVELNPAFAKDFSTTYAELGAWVTSPEGGGLPPEMWNQTFDHRLVNMAHMAMQFAKATRSQPKVSRQIASQARVIRPGAPPEPGQAKHEDYEVAKARMREHSSLENIADAFLARERAKRA